MPEEGLKTELPTEKRLAESVAEGNFAKTPDVHTVFVLAAAFGVLVLTAREQSVRVLEFSSAILSAAGTYSIHEATVLGWVRPSIGGLLSLVLPMACFCGLASLLAGGVQSHFQMTPKVLEFKFSRLDPFQGFQRVFSMQGWVKLLTDAFKLAVVGAIIYSAIKRILSDPMFYTPVDVTRIASFIFDTVTMLLGRFIMAIGAIGAVNYVYQLRRVGESIKMTKQEVKEERRSTEGDPMIRNARRQMARRLLQKQMLSAVPTADVVITNPTHFAVALKYQRGIDKAPIVLAKGERLFAQRIKAIAAENEVPMVENKPVARMLFKYGKVGKPIPLELYQTVAEILAFVYKTYRYYFHRIRAQRDAE